MNGVLGQFASSDIVITQFGNYVKLSSKPGKLPGGLRLTFTTSEATHVTLLAWDQTPIEFFLSLFVYEVSGLFRGHKIQAFFLLKSTNAINH